MTDTQRIDPQPAWKNLAAAPLRLALQPLLRRVVQRIASHHPSMFTRLAPYQKADFVIIAHELPFALHLRPDPDAPLLRAVPKSDLPAHIASIEGPFALLLSLIDGETDGDAAFFSRELIISGNTEAVVSLRNALDDVEGSIALETAGLFGPPGRAALNFLRQRRKTNG